MSNKLYGDNVSNYLVEGDKSKGYLKNSNKGFGDGATSNPVKDYNSKGSFEGTTDNWFEGNKSGKGFSVER